MSTVHLPWPALAAPGVPNPHGPVAPAAPADQAKGPDERSREPIQETTTFTLVDLVTPVRSVHASFSEAAREAAAFRFPEDLLILVHEGPHLILVLTATGGVVRTRHTRSTSHRSPP